MSREKLRTSRERTWNDVRDWQMTEKIFQAHKHQRMKSVEFSVHWLGSTNQPKDYSTLPRLLVRNNNAITPDLAVCAISTVPVSMLTHSQLRYGAS
jgi:hypothetical protein